MQFVIMWLTLALAHVLADFVLQRSAVVRGKGKNSKRAYAEHGAVHFTCMVVALAAFAGGAALRFETIGVLVVVVIVHLGLDVTKEGIGAPADGQPRRWPFIVDQVLHFIVITLAAIVISASSPSAEPSLAWSRISDQVLVLMFGYSAVIFAAGHFNAVLLRPFSELYGLRGNSGRRDDEAKVDQTGLARAGMVIGILERFLIMTAVLAGSPAGVGLVVAAKSVFRFEDAKKGRHNAEYFLIGTFLSVTEAVIGGIVVRQLLDLVAGAV
jgi:hypothetical protein